MMRFLLAVIFTVFPLTIHAQLLDVPHSSSSTPNVRADSADAWNEADMDNAINELSPYGNPYAPASPTNFEALIRPYLDLQGQQGILLHDPDMFDVNAGGSDSPGSISHRYKSNASSPRSLTHVPSATTSSFKDPYGSHNHNGPF